MLDSLLITWTFCSVACCVFLFFAFLFILFCFFLYASLSLTSFGLCHLALLFVVLHSFIPLSFNLGILLQTTGHFVEARDTYTTALDIYKLHFGDSAESTQDIMAALRKADFLIQQQQQQLAQQEQQTAPATASGSSSSPLSASLPSPPELLATGNAAPSASRPGIIGAAALHFTTAAIGTVSPVMHTTSFSGSRASPTPTATVPSSSSSSSASFAASSSPPRVS